MTACTDPRHDPDNPCDYDTCEACRDECEPPTSDEIAQAEAFDAQETAWEIIGGQ